MKQNLAGENTDVDSFFFFFYSKPPIYLDRALVTTSPVLLSIIFIENMNMCKLSVIKVCHI